MHHLATGIEADLKHNLGCIALEHDVRTLIPLPFQRKGWKELLISRVVRLG